MADSVHARREAVTFPTYTLPPADKNPVFFDKRVYQGSSGKVYPLPVFDRLSPERKPREWDAWYLENEYVRVMMLPEIGGRVHEAFDKTANYHFFYRQDVIKPALVGLGGPWCSGGVEWNWPQHHRPSTYMPVDSILEEHEDGSRTLWMSEHDPMFHLKGMVGICVHPGSSVIEAKVRLYNRTAFTQSFLWWANVGVSTHDNYQSFFPPDVHFVADHAVRAMSSFPIARNHYYGVDYRPGTDLRWYKNIPVPTSYMVLHSDYDFLGGYDHDAQAGFVQVANRHIAPGKKQWTWGNHAFGWAWDRELTEENGPYIELMSGAYTNNQPDFSYLAPYETKTFSQYWWPIQKIGIVHNASRDFALHLEVKDGAAEVGVAASQKFAGAHVVLKSGVQVVLDKRIDVAPGEPFVSKVQLPQRASEAGLELLVEADGSRLSYRPEPIPEHIEIPPLATEPPMPDDVKSADELYFIGEHLDQYRHATRYPELYWKEALRRDPGDARCNAALGVQALKRGLFADAEKYLRKAVARLTHRHPNPVDGEAIYYLGLTLRYQNRDDEAYRWFYKATWNYSWRSPAYYHLGCIDCKGGDWETALAHLEASLAVNAMNSKANALRCVVLRRMDRWSEAKAHAEAGLQIDPLDHNLRNELWWSIDNDPDQAENSANYVRSLEVLGEHYELLRDEAQTYIDAALDYAEAGCGEEADDLLEHLLSRHRRAAPMCAYILASIHEHVDSSLGDAYRREAAAAISDYCFPNRLEEELALREAIELNTADARAPYYLGCYLYDKKRTDEAIQMWELSRERDSEFPTTHRNLGIAYYNVQHDGAKALESYERAFELDRNDARVLFELDQLRKKLGHAPEERLALLDRYPQLIEMRDDLSIEHAALLNALGLHDRALQIVANRTFHPWEGGEGKVLAQHVATHLGLGRAALAEGQPEQALKHFESAMNCPHNLGEARHLLAATADIDYHLGLANEALGDDEVARKWFTKAAEAAQDFADMAVASFSKMTYYKAAALQKLGREQEAAELLDALEKFAREKLATTPKIDYFATSLPDLLMFDEDLKQRSDREATFLLGLAHLGRGHFAEAANCFRKVLLEDPSHLDSELFHRLSSAGINYCT